MIVSAFLTLFFGGFAFGSLHTARQDYRWRNASEVHGVLIKQGSAFHYEYRPPAKAAVIGPTFYDRSSSQKDGMVNDWARLEYDPALPEQLRQHFTRSRLSTNFRNFLFTLSFGCVFLFAALLALWNFFRALYDKLSTKVTV